MIYLSVCRIQNLYMSNVLNLQKKELKQNIEFVQTATTLDNV